MIEQQHGVGRQVTRVLAGVPASVHLVAGEPRGLRIRGQENLLPYLVLSERGDKLEIEVKDGYRLDPTEPLEITITLPALHELALAGVANGELRGFKGRRWCCRWPGSVTSSPTGSSWIGWRATSRAQAAWIWGTARPGPSSSTSLARGCAGAELKGREVEVNIAGSGDVEVRAQDRLKVGIAGSGSVSYWGDPVLQSEIAGSGEVSRQGS